MIRLILDLDHERSEELVGLMAKALGRGEQGILAMRLEPYDAGLEVTITAKPAAKDVNLKSLIKRLPEAEALSEEELKAKTRRPKAPGKKKPLGGAAHLSFRARGIPPASDLIYAALQKATGPMSAVELSKELEKYGYSPNSINTGLKRARDNYSDIIAVGEYKKTRYVLAKPAGPDFRPEPEPPAEPPAP